MGGPRFSYLALLTRATCAALLKKSRMKSINATGLHRKSGGKPTGCFQWRIKYMIQLAAITAPKNSTKQ
jgi:hypothetical protein